MPPKAMTQEAIKDLVAQIIEELKIKDEDGGETLDAKKDKEKVKTEWGDETEGE